MKKTLIVVQVSLFLSCVESAWADEVATLDTRPGVKQSVLLIEPPGEIKGVVMGPLPRYVLPGKHHNEP